MKKLFFALFMFCYCFNSFAQSKSDSLQKKTKYFVGINVGYGIGWRVTSDISDSLIDYFSPLKISSKDDSKGKSYNFSIHVGYALKRWKFATGVEYYYADYNNKKGVLIDQINNHGQWENVMYPFTLKYVRRFVAIPFSASYFIGKSQKWAFGINIDYCFLLENYLNIAPPSYYYISGEPKLKIIEHFGLIGGSVERKLYEKNNFCLSIKYNFNYSSTIGLKENRHDYAPYSIYYESKPIHMVTSNLNLEVLYKF
jgi:hypothetical protein